MQDIHDIKPLMSVDFPWFSVIVALCLMLGSIVLFAWLLRQLFKRLAAWRERDPAESAEESSPRKWALKELKALKSRQLEPARFYLQLEKILKTFLEKLHQQPFTSYTSQQFVAFLQAHAHTENLIDDLQLGQLLLRSQQAKFAGQLISSSEMQQDWEHAQAFVNSYTAKG